MNSSFRPVLAKNSPIMYHSSMSHYLNRINSVLDYIDRNLEKRLTLEELAGAACFSKYHFSRVFAAAMGENLFHYIQRRRLEKAASRLIREHSTSIMEIAMDAGFESSSSFSKSFKARFGKAPGQFRNTEQLKSNFRQDNSTDAGNTCYNPVTNTWRSLMNNQHVLVEVRKLKPFTAACIRNIGPYAGNSELFEGLFGRLFQWAGARNLVKDKPRILTLYHDNPEITADEHLQISVCLEVPPDTEIENSSPVRITSIPGGLYAVGKFEIHPSEYTDAWKFMYGKWLAGSMYEPDDREYFECHLMNPKDHPEGKHAVEIHVPVRRIK